MAAAAANLFSFGAGRSGFEWGGNRAIDPRFRKAQIIFGIEYLFQIALGEVFAYLRIFA